MAYWERVHVPPDFQGVTRSERQGGSYLRYHPDLLIGTPNELDPALAEYAAEVSTALGQLGERLRANPLPILYSTMIRSESIASSWIEGIRETPRAVAVAQIGDEGASSSASQIVANVTAMREAIELLGAGSWEHEHIEQIHHDLLPRHRRGYRRDQVWVGGRHKLNAQYTAPPPEKVQLYMDDLLAYANTSGDLPVIAAAIVHAQFETIHPFTDGNGRVGRALAHGVLKRAGLIDNGVIALSTAFRDDERGYVAALTSYRYDGDGRAPALNAYLERFLHYVATATAAADAYVDAALAIHSRWRTAVAGVRKDSSLHQAVDLVVENPVISASFLGERLGVSLVSSHKLVQKLVAAGIVVPATGRKLRRSALYQAEDILGLLELGSEPASEPAAGVAAAGVAAGGPTVLHRCGHPTAKGPCQNRVAVAGQPCWRHRD